MGGEIRSRLSYANVTATLALFVALGGGAYAAANLPANSVGTSLIQNKAVTPPKLSRSTINLLKGKRGPQGLQGAEGSQGPPGSNATIDGVSAGGSLTGTYPSPTIASDAVGASQLANGSVSTAKFAPGAQAPDSAELGGMSASTYATVGGTFTAATLNPGAGSCYWTNYGGGQTPASYYRDAFGIVHLRGLVVAHDFNNPPFPPLPCGASPNDAAIFTLPAGYTPDYAYAEAAISNDNPGRVSIGTNGSVAIEPNFPSWTDAKAWVSLDGIAFRCGPSGQNGCP